MERLAVFILLIGALYAKDIKFLPCPDFPSTAANVTVSIEPCDSNPCKIVKGKTTSINVHFTPQSEVKTLNVEVKAHLGPIWIPYSIDKSDACKDSGLTCPLPATKEQSYEYALKVSTSYPSLELVLQWNMVDDTGKSPVCVRFPISVTTSAKFMYEEESLALIP